MQTFRLTLNFVDPPGLIKLSREREENPTHVGDACGRVSNMNNDFWTRRMGLEESPIPVSVVHHAFLELREERLKLFFGYSHRGRPLKRCGKRN